MEYDVSHQIYESHPNRRRQEQPSHSDNKSNRVAMEPVRVAAVENLIQPVTLPIQRKATPPIPVNIHGQHIRVSNTKAIAADMVITITDARLA